MTPPGLVALCTAAISTPSSTPSGAAAPAVYMPITSGSSVSRPRPRKRSRRRMCEWRRSTSAGRTAVAGGVVITFPSRGEKP